MKTCYKYICLLLAMMCCMQVYAYQYGRNNAIHVLRAGIAAGGVYNITPATCDMSGKLGASGSVVFDYAFYKSQRTIDLGFRTGVDVGYLNERYHADFSQQFTNMDYLNNQMDYTTSGSVDVTQHQLYASIPLMFALRSNGFVWNIGLRLQAICYQTGKQQLSAPMIEAYYPTYNVHVTNELITGVVADDQLSMPTQSEGLQLECQASTEIGYEHNLSGTNAIGILAYFNVGFWNNHPKVTSTPVIDIAPITDSQHPAPAVTINDAKSSLLTSYIPLQFGVKLYYAFFTHR